MKTRRQAYACLRVGLCLGLFVQGLELHQVLVAGLGVVLVRGEQTFGAVGELAGQAAVAGLVHQELTVAVSGLLAVEREGLLGIGVEAEEGKLIIFVHVV